MVVVVDADVDVVVVVVVVVLVDVVFVFVVAVAVDVVFVVVVNVEISKSNTEVVKVNKVRQAGHPCSTHKETCNMCAATFSVDAIAPWWSDDEFFFLQVFR